MVSPNGLTFILGSMVYNFAASTCYLDLALIRLPLLSKYSTDFYKFKLSKRYLFKYACSLGILMRVKNLKNSEIKVSKN